MDEVARNWQEGKEDMNAGLDIEGQMIDWRD
jgi:hypothetical protein